MATITGQTSIAVPAKVSDKIISEAVAATGLSSLVNVQVAIPGETIQTYDLAYHDARFHNPTTDTKTVDAETVKTIDVRMYDFYKIFKVADSTEAAVPNVIAQMQRDLPVVLGATLQKAIFPVSGLVEGNPWTDVLPSPVEVNLSTAAGWQTAIDVKGYSGLLLADGTKTLLANALTEGSNVNPLSFGIDDGQLVGGKPAYFSDLGETELTDIAGVAGDWSKALLYIDPVLSMARVDSTTSYQMMLEDSVAFKVKWRVGFGVADKARFKTFKQSA